MGGNENVSEQCLQHRPTENRLVAALFPGLVNESGDRSTDLNMLAPGINKRHDDLDNNGRLPEPAPKQRNGHWQMHYGF